jgi:transcription-repair coupling factor (superfamily II helicase)
MLIKGPFKPNTKKHFSNFIGSNLSIELSRTLKDAKQQAIILTQNSESAARLHVELSYLLNGTNKSISLLPTYEILPYDHFSASDEILSQRIAAFYKMLNSNNAITILDASALSNWLPSPEKLSGLAFQVRVGQILNLTDYTKSLERQAYIHVNQVNARGEYAIRGNIIDIFPMGSNTPYRIELFDDEIETIRAFDINEQTSAHKVDEINILPAHEIHPDHQTINTFCANWQNIFGDKGTDSAFYKSIVKGNISPGIESFTNIFYDTPSSLFDYIPKDSLVFHVDDTQSQLNAIWRNITERFGQLGFDNKNPILEPTRAFLSPEEVNKKLKLFPQVHLHAQSEKDKAVESTSASLPELHIHYQYQNPYQKLDNFYKDNKQLKFIFSADSKGRLEVLLDHLKKINVKPERFDSFFEALQSKKQICILVSPLSQGFIDANTYCLITESCLFKHHVPNFQATKKHKAFDSGNEFRDLAELTPGDAVVHIDHGVGRYEGLTLLQLGENQNEFLTITYANNEKLYVPINALHLVSRYSGANIDHAPINKLGTDKWEKTKEKAAKKIQDVAADLLQIYAERATKEGFTNSIKKNDYLAFCETFPFEETEDQLKAINEVVTDMLSDKPMDRLICGDVGFGKTEIAMRAAFIAVHNNKQVAILVPTTLLAQQHFENFQERFTEVGAKVEVLSRFKTAKQQTEVIGQLKSGNVDIIIGTHKLLSKDIQFKDLGLLIIDEEHRFGVTHKEKIKALRANIDILTMTATPIPRTLNMALSNIRDLSIIATPPAKRLSVKTFVQEQKDGIINEAISREVFRGGQVYFLHNKVDTIYARADELQKKFKNVRVIVAHGQMRERELEQVMLSFQQKQYQILVCTTIIETGIDIPNANTIIIERADNFGLAQLHQLRGRVGRSHHQAYAYLLTPPTASLNKDAVKRLEAISEAESLGGGFILANNDLEIRGSGELLGKEQSGNIDGVGFSLYLELLNKTIKSLQSGHSLSTQEILTASVNKTEIELRIPALIPEDYIFDVHTRLIFYKRISTAENPQTLDSIKIDLVDRFGLVPIPLNNLFETMLLKFQAIKYGIQKIEMHSGGGSIKFIDTPPIDPICIIKMVQLNPNFYQLTRDNKILLKNKLLQAQERINFIKETLERLQNHHAKGNSHA